MNTSSRVVSALVTRYGLEGAHARVELILAGLTNCELAAHENDWAGMWARPKQLPPSNDWQSWGFLTGRGFGKTVAISKYINSEVEAGRAPLILLMAQDEQSAIDIQVKGPSGLIATAPHWFKPVWLASEMVLVWPNGSRAYVRTPEVPGKVRGLEYNLAWLSEVQSWPVATREEAYMNALLSTRLGFARIVWDATPKRRHPILQRLLAMSLVDTRHVVVRGSTHENRANLGAGYIEKLEAEMGNTQRGREELLGEILDDSDNALVKSGWILRRQRPEKFAYRVVSVDPAITSRKGSDTTGIVEAGLGADGQAYVIGDDSGKHHVARWADITLDRYVTGCDLVIAETNKGGDFVAQNLRAAGERRGLTIVVVGKDDRPKRLPGTVFVKEVHARGAKDERAQPVATAYEKGRISHVIGADLSSIEDTLTTWEASPHADSPGDLDALVHGIVELLALGSNVPDRVAAAKAAFKGIPEANAALRAPQRGPRPGISRLLGGGGSGGGRI
jgi:phage terminase large subunit-like protein